MSESVSGRFVWRELVDARGADAAAFYANLFGWSVHETDMGGGAPYRMLRNDGLDEDVAGVMRPMMEGVPPHWLDYITVDDVDAALARVVELGGQGITAVIPLPIGRFAVVRSATPFFAAAA